LAGQSALQKDAQTIRHAGERAAGLTRQLLVFSRKQTIQSVVLDLNAVVKDMEKMLGRLIDENVELVFNLGEHLGRIKADSGYVGQVLMNLVVNARDAMPNGGKITVETADVTLDDAQARAHPGAAFGNFVMLSVADTGTGMTEEVKARMFEAFFTTKPKGKGTGLGLATCQTIMQQCGGHIAVASELGRGTTFRVYFPRVHEDIKTAETTFRKKPMARGTETLLVVEDEPAVRQLACRVLETQGYHVIAATNGQDGLHAARQHKGAPIKLVITDVIMPEMGGKVMAEWLKSSYPDLKILFTSGYTDDALADHGVLEQGVAFLPKPYNPASLARSIPELLRMVPGLDVAQIDANHWAVSSRGFNDQYANKLLVLIDGRSVYTPVSAGVFWNVQDVPLDDIDRIEVIRGPGATLWGANAVNGVINIITKSARDTQGGLVTVVYGTENQPYTTVQYDGQLATNLFYRAYVTYFNRDNFVDSTGQNTADAWNAIRGGFRMDWEPTAENNFTLQGDYYSLNAGEMIDETTLTPPFVNRGQFH
jgi:CheY-like chemotaxis protein